MTLTLNLPPEMEQYLVRSAQQKGLSVEDLTLQMLNECMPNQALEDLIPPGTACEIWSPYDAYDAAKIMMQALQNAGEDEDE